MGTLPLFDEPSSFDRERLRTKLAGLAQRGVLIGTSSWKYPGWLGQIYTSENYYTRGRFSERRFAAECLNEYARTFPIVCGDFSFYQFPSENHWSGLFGSAPRSLRYAFKVPEEITVKAFPTHPRYGPRSGAPNETFLNRELLEGGFLDALRPYRAQVAALIFEFGTFSRQCFRDVSEFLKELDPFLAALPRDFRYAVEIRNPEFLALEYFGSLRRHRVAHVFNSWTRMPAIGEQMMIEEAFTADFTLTRALLRPGRAYEEAVARFKPYRETLDPSPETREALRSLIARASDRNEAAYMFINNRLEGNAPLTIEAILE